MCINPRRLMSGIEVPCRNCWQCRAARVNDWVGRCIAEGETATATNAVTLTYGPDADGNKDHVRSAVLTYSDVQKYFKLLRRHGYPCRYFAAGEFGGAKGRAHWHVIIFWLKEVPCFVADDGSKTPYPLAKRFDEPHWPHGFSHWEPVSESSVRYVCKYIQKDVRDGEQQTSLAMSKYPPLGSVYFDRLAKRYAQQGLVPHRPQYRFPNVTDKATGKPIEFWMHGKTRDNFLASYLKYWEAINGGHPPQSDLLDDYLDRQAKYLPDLQPKPFRPSQPAPWINPPPGGTMSFSEAHNTWRSTYADGQSLFWSFNDKGKRAWHAEVRTETVADRLREAYERRGTSERYRAGSRGL